MILGALACSRLPHSPGRWFHRLSGLPSLIPVGLHTIIAPEEHRRRFRVARQRLGPFHHALAGDLDRSWVAAADPVQRQEQGLQHYLAPVDDGDALINPAELDRVLHSIGERPLTVLERQRLFGAGADSAGVTFSTGCW